MRSRTQLLMLFSALPVTAALLIAAPSAVAGTYVVYSCKQQNFAGIGGMGDWYIDVTNSSRQRTNTNCHTGSISMELLATTQHNVSAPMQMRFAAPPNTRVLDWVVWRTATVKDNYTYTLFESTAPSGSEMVEQCVGSKGCRLKGASGPVSADANKISRFGRTAVTGLRFRIECVPESLSTCPAGGAGLQLHRADIRLKDDLVPVIVGKPSVTQANGKVSVAVNASDSGGGVYQGVLALDGKEVARTHLNENGGRCRKPFLAALPCAAQASGAVSFDARSVLPGQHALRLTVTDAANNQAVWSTNVTVSGRNGGGVPDACSTKPRVASLDIRAGIGKTWRRTTTAPYGRRKVIAGRLRTPAGAPVANAPVCVLVRKHVRRARNVLAGTVTTDANGGFSYTLPRGPSRRVTFVHRTAGGAVSARVLARVRAPVTLHATPPTVRSGRSLLLRGRLGAGRRRGVQVEIQWYDGNSWEPFRTRQTRAGGRFRLRYVFQRSRGEFKLRARVPRQGDHPYAAGKSRTVRVRVRG